VPGLTAVIDGNWWPVYALAHALPVNEGRACLDVPFGCGLAQTWSLVVEVTFYAALPLYAYAAARLTSGLALRRWMLAELTLLAALSALSIALQFLVLESGSRWLGGSVLGYVFWFALGMAMAVVSVRWSDDRKPGLLRWVGARPEVPWLVALGVYVLLCFWLPPSTFLLEQGDMFVAHVGFGIIALLLLVPAVFEDHSGGVPRRLLARPVVAWLGLVSYGIFLWHYVVTLELGTNGAGASFVVVLLGSLAISITVAALSYYLVERPLLRLKYRRLRVACRPRLLRREDHVVGAEAAHERGALDGSLDGLRGTETPAGRELGDQAQLG
jgi:peptidoglycan/LPS O-acetylase OafA/YrhL